MSIQRPLLLAALLALAACANPNGPLTSPDEQAVSSDDAAVTPSAIARALKSHAGHGSVSRRPVL